MSFREKMHWAAFAGLVAGFGWYVLTFPWAIVGTPAGIDAVASMLVPVSALILGVMAIVAIYLAIRYPRDVSAREDERERDIHRRGTHAAYYPLVLGSYGVLIAVFNKWSGATLLNLILAVAIGAELIRVGWQLWLYRRSGV